LAGRTSAGRGGNSGLTVYDVRPDCIGEIERAAGIVAQNAFLHSQQRLFIDADQVRQMAPTTSFGMLLTT